MEKREPLHRPLWPGPRAEAQRAEEIRELREVKGIRAEWRAEPRVVEPKTRVKKPKSKGSTKILQAFVPASFFWLVRARATAERRTVREVIMSGVRKELGIDVEAEREAELNEAKLGAE